jgi:release factor glutamine methyltransferase
LRINILNKNKLEKTFNYKRLTISIHKEVYDPAEDTFLLLDSLIIKPGDRVFEIGTGCGIIGLYCATIGADVLCCDINPFAVELVKKNYQQNLKLLKGNFEVRIGDIFSVLNKEDLFDIIVFNPPYLPTSFQDLVGGSGWFDKSVDGGTDGLNTTKRFIESVSNYLKKDGCAYFIFSSLSNRKKLNKIINQTYLNKTIISSKKFNDEQLDVYCLKK